MGFSLYVTCCFSLAAFSILYLCLVFVSLISMCLGVFLLGFILYGTLCASWTWLTISFSMLGKFSIIISSKIFSYPFFFFSSGTPIIQILVHLILSQRWEMATHSSVLAWKIPGTVEPGGLLYMGLHRVGHDWSNLTVTVTGREVGGGFMFGNTCTPVVDSCQCMAKPIQYFKVK